MSRSLPLFLSLIPPFILFLSLPFRFFFFFFESTPPALGRPSISKGRLKAAGLEGRPPALASTPPALKAGLGEKAAGLSSQPFSPSSPSSHPSKNIIQTPQFRTPNPPTSNSSTKIRLNSSIDTPNTSTQINNINIGSKHKRRLEIIP